MENTVSNFYGEGTLQNATPQIYAPVEARPSCDDDTNPHVEDPFDSREVFDLVRSIYDPEHPLTLEQLHVVNLNDVFVNDIEGKVLIKFTPTIPHCSMAMMIGLCIRVKLARCLPSRFKCDVSIAPGTHVQEEQITKQLADKERVAAALERRNILQVVNMCLNSRS